MAPGNTAYDVYVKTVPMSYLRTAQRFSLVAQVIELAEFRPVGHWYVRAQTATSPLMMLMGWIFPDFPRRTYRIVKNGLCRLRRALDHCLRRSSRSDVALFDLKTFQHKSYA